MKPLIMVFFAFFSTQFVLAQDTSVRLNNFNIKKSVAIEGYDPVSYHSSKPAEGKSSLTYDYQGVIYWFSSQSNLNRFKTDPEKYEPAYGGWCAFAMGETGEKVKIDPETFKILDGKLYLFYNFWGNDTLTDWNKDEKVLKAKGDQNWKKFIQ